jgi:hypothetical protein
VGRERITQRFEEEKKEEGEENKLLHMEITVLLS